jgi:hypothetical protein
VLLELCAVQAVCISPRSLELSRVSVTNAASQELHALSVLLWHSAHEPAEGLLLQG